MESKSTAVLTRDEADFLKRCMAGVLDDLPLLVACYPADLVSVLTRIGYEPFPLRYGQQYLLFGRKGWYLPNAFSYAVSLGKAEGYTRLFTGLHLCIARATVFVFSTSLTLVLIDRYVPGLKTKYRLEANDGLGAARQQARHCIRLALARSVGIFVACPIRVLVIRRIASIVGGETDYLSFYNSAVLVFENEGVSGFFKGLVPMVIAVWGQVWLTGFLGLAVERFFVTLFHEKTEEEMENDRNHNPSEDRLPPQELERNSSLWNFRLLETEEGPGWLRTGLKLLVPMVVCQAIHPFRLTATLLAINNVGLAAGILPYAPPFGGWMECYTHLRMSGALFRGYRLIFRHYLGAINFRQIPVPYPML